jgi:DNA-binding NtrC family response regulator
MDIPLLAQYFLEKFSRQQNKDVRKLSTYALDILSRYHFPGNVRELENIIERSVALEQSNIILPESLQLADFKRQSSLSAAPADAFLSWKMPDSAQPPNFNESFLPPSPFGPGNMSPGASGPPLATPVPPANNNNIEEATPKNANPVLDFKSLQLVPGGLDDILASLEGYYLYNALMTAGGNRSRTSNLVGISPWRLRMRLLAFNLADLNPVELMSLSKDKFPKPALPLSIAPDWIGGSIKLDDILHAVERQFIKLALDNSNANKTEAANALGLSRRSFQHRIERTNYESFKDSPELNSDTPDPDAPPTEALEEEEN